MEISGYSLQPFTEDEWRLNQLERINTLQKVMNRRIESVVSKYRNEFFHWDINNEILHYEKKLGPKANLRMFKKVQREDPQVTLFLNEFNIIENCDRNINVAMYIEKFKQLKKGAIKVKNKLQILREAFSHPSVNRIMLWSALGKGGCYRMCLTDYKFNNLPTGDLIDQLLLREWKTGTQRGKTNEFGYYNFRGFLREYELRTKISHKNIKVAKISHYFSK
uniref:GH10 domain-containing protein n=1 Tax=Solanum lycopersicum TaxID=4081 RepID=K4D1C6_SOLLC